MRLILPSALATLSLWALPSAGVKAPPLSLAHVLQAPAGQAPSWAALKGHAVVLEFWATWCTGCREQIAHLNSLERQFRGRPLRFISITDEEPEIVSRFLKDYPISGWIGIDDGGRTVRDYGIAGWPMTVLVDAAGIVRGVGNPAEITASVLEPLLAGKPLNLEKTGRPLVKLQTAPEPFFQLMIRPAAPVSVTGYSPGAQSGSRGRRWEAWGIPLPALLSSAYGVPEGRVEAAPGIEWDKQTRFDVIVASPDLTEANRRALLRSLLEATFELKAKTTRRDLEVLVLEAPEGEAHRLRPSSSASSQWGA